MYCTGCGKEIPDDSRFCPNCGKSSVQEKSNASGGTSELIQKAKDGDQSAISILYEQTYNQVYYTVKSMIKDEDAVFDILQDSYIKAFSHLDSFEGGDRFTAWVRQIAANTARDWMKKKRPMLFSELEQSSDMDLPAEEWFEDENTDHLPEYVIDQNETSRLIREILDELPEDQRAAIGMYYYEEMSVKEIAASMNATENAVKSRLLYGRQKIEKKVRELEKKGTKLYGLAPIPFLLWLLRGQKAYAAEVPNAGIRQNILRSVSSSSSATPKGTVHTAKHTPAHVAKHSAAHTAKTAGTAKAATAAGAGFSGVKVAVAAIAAIAVIGGGVFGITRLSRHTEQPEQPITPVVAEDTPVIQETTMPAVPEVTAAETVVEATSEPEAEAPEDPIDEALDQYRIILANAATYDFGEYAYPNGEYLYALGYMHTGDPVPTLLLCQLGDDYIDHVRIFYYDVDSQTILAPEEVITTGVAQTGGFRGGLSMMGDGNGLQIFEVGGMRGDIYISRAIRSDNSMIITQEWTGFLDDNDPYRDNAREITWYNLSDEAGFRKPDKNTETADIATDSTPTEQDATALWISAEEAAGRTILTGTVDTITYDEAVELQGYPDYNAADKGQTWVIIRLDSPQVLKGTQDVSTWEKEHSIILIWTRLSSGIEYGENILSDYTGEHIICSAGSFSKASDTSVPYGVPWAHDIHVLNE